MRIQKATKCSRAKKAIMLIDYDLQWYSNRNSIKNCDVHPQNCGRNQELERRIAQNECYAKKFQTKQEVGLEYKDIVYFLNRQ